MTLRELIKKHPEYADLDIVVYSSDGTYHHIDGSGSFYQHEYFPESMKNEEVIEGTGTPVLVMAPN